VSARGFWASDRQDYEVVGKISLRGGWDVGKLLTDRGGDGYRAVVGGLPRSSRAGPQAL